MDPVQSCLSVRAVEKVFGKVRAVDGVSFQVGGGRIAGLIGRNGAGKTTTLRMVNGIFLPDSGAIDLFGGVGLEKARDRIGYLPEERGLYKQMKVMEHLLFLAEIKGRKPSSVRPKAEAWLERMELGKKRDTRLEELSKGNQQKVQLIGALLHEPELLILDEPMSGLDPVNVVLVRGILKELRAEGRAILLSTHMMDEAERMVDDIVLIHEGRVVVEGALDDVRAAHGRNTVHLEFEGDGAFLAVLPGIVRSRVQTRSAEIELSPGIDPQPLVQAAAARLRLLRLDIAAPSLEEIFIERVGGAAKVIRATQEVPA